MPYEIAAKKILFLSYEEYPLFIGLNTRLKGLAKSLSKQNYHIEIVAPSYKNDISNSQFTDFGVTLHNIKLFNFFGRKSIPIVSRALFVIVYTITVYRYLQKLKRNFDFIQSEQLYPLLVSILIKHRLKAKVILDDPTILQVLIDDKIKSSLLRVILTKCVQWYELLTYKHTDYIFCSSFKTMHYIESYHSIKDKKKLKYVPNGVDTEIFYPKKISKWSNRLFFNCSLPFYQNLEALRNLIMIIENLDKEKTYQYSLTVIVNDEALVPDDKRRFFEEKSHVRLLCAVHNIAEYIQKSDVALLPYAKGHNLTAGSRLKALEYMACGKVIVSTPEGIDGLMGIEHKKNILLADDVESFPKILFGLADESTRKLLIPALEENAWKLINENYKWGKIVESYYELI